MKKYLLLDNGFLLEYIHKDSQYSVNTAPVRVFEPLGENTMYVLNSDENTDTGNIRDNSTFLINKTLSQYYLLNDDNVAYSYTEETNTKYVNSIVNMSGINMEYDTFRLRLSQTFAYNSNTGMHYRIYTEYQGRIINLASIFDQSANSNIIASSEQVRFENTFYVSELTVKAPSLDFICQDDNTEVQKLRLALFGTTAKITTPMIFVEYKIIDELETVTGNYKRFVLDGVERIGFIPKADDTGLYLGARFDENGILILEVGYNGSGDLQSYLNTLSTNTDDNWIIRYQLNIVGLNGGIQAQNDYYTIRNEEDFSQPVLYYPVLLNAVDAANIRVTAAIENLRTNLILYRELNLPIVDTDRYKITKPETILSITVNQTKAYNRIVKVNPQITGKSKLSSANTIIKPIFVSMLNFNQDIILYEEDSNVVFTIENENVTVLNNVSTVYLSIGGELISEKTRPSANKLRFKLSKSLYNTSATKYYILDENKEIISTGNIVKA